MIYRQTIRRALVRLAMSVEIMVVGYYFLYGQQSIFMIWHLWQENCSLQNNIMNLQQEVYTLETQVKMWQHCSYYKEKIAREQLNMAHQDDLIYYSS